MSEEGYLATQRARIGYHDRSAAFARQLEADAANEESLVRETGIRNLGAKPTDGEQTPGSGEQTGPGGQVSGGTAVDGTLTMDQELDLAGGLATDVAQRGAEAVEQIGVGILKAAGSTVEGLAQVTGVEQHLSDFTTWAGENFNVPTLRTPTTIGGVVGQEVGRYGAGFAAGGTIAKSAGLVWGYGRAIFADAFTEFFAYDETNTNIADVVGMFSDWEPETLTEARSVFVDALSKDEDDTAVEARLKNMAANSGAGLAIDGLVLTYKAMRAMAKSPALLTEAHRLGIAARRAAPGPGAEPHEIQKAAAGRLAGAVAAMTEAAKKGANP